MKTLAALSVGVMVLLSGCATTRPASLAPGTAAARACPPVDPKIDALSTRIEMHKDREGFYARAELASVARDSDDLVRHLVVQHGQLRACMPPGPARNDALWQSRVRMIALLDGVRPGVGGHAITMTDVRRPPHIFPFFTRVCVDGTHGLEDGFSCYLAYGPYLAIFDVATAPLGTWFWAAPDRKERLELREAFPAPPGLVEEVVRVLEGE